MTQQSTVSLQSAVGSGSIREDLQNFISNVDRDETPLISMVSMTKASNVRHDWLTDVYNDPMAQTVLEGAPFHQVGIDANDPNSAAAGTMSNQTARTRLDNWTQIFREQIEVSNTAVAVNTAGIANEFAYQIKKKGVEVRRNVEYQATRYNATGSLKNGGATRRMGSLFTYIANPTGTGRFGNLVDNQSTAGTFTYATPGTGASLPVLSGGTGGPRAVQRDSVEELITNMYGNGGRPNVCLISHRLKTSFSRQFNANNTTSTVDTIRRMTSMEDKLNIAISGVMTDFGFDIGIKPSYIMQLNGATSHALLFDTNMVQQAVLRKLSVGRFDDNGDGKRALMTTECTLQVKNPNSVGAIFNLAS